MFVNSLKLCSQLKIVNGGFLAAGNNAAVGQGALRVGQNNYSKVKGSCCKDIAQTEGKQVEVWPKPDPPPHAWRAECPCEPQPPNYDPYKIKVPDIVVPPMPPSNAKDLSNDNDRELFTNPEINHNQTATPNIQDLFRNSAVVHPDYWRGKPDRMLPSIEPSKEVLPKLGYHGRIKYKFAFHEPWKPLNRMSLLEKAEKLEAESSSGAVLNKPELMS